MEQETKKVEFIKVFKAKVVIGEPVKVFGVGEIHELSARLAGIAIETDCAVCAEEVSEEEENDLDLMSLTVAQLKDQADVFGIEIKKGAKKAEIVALLESYSDAFDNESDEDNTGDETEEKTEE